MLAAVADFGTNPGALDMYEYAPADLPAGAPLVVVLHGCTQTATAMETAGWNTLADANHFAVVYPQQRSANNPLACFLWYDPVAEVTADLLAAYPDRFVAGSIMAGIPAGCASDVSTATQCTSGVDKTPAQWGDLARAAKPGFTGPFPRVQICRRRRRARQCPATTGAFFTDEKICSTLRAAVFFDIAGAGGTPPPKSTGGGCNAGGVPSLLVLLGLWLRRLLR